MEDEEFERFLEESLKIAESIETSLDIAIQRDRCNGKLQKIYLAYNIDNNSLFGRANSCSGINAKIRLHAFV